MSQYYMQKCLSMKTDIPGRRDTGTMYSYSDCCSSQTPQPVSMGRV